MPQQINREQIDILKAALSKNADPERALSMSKYMKEKFSYFGIPSPTRKKIAAPIVKHWKSQIEDPEALCKAIFDVPERECHYIAIEYLSAAWRQWSSEIVDTFEYLITTHSWWDTVDYIATNLVGKFYMKNGIDQEKIYQWNKSENMWLNRVSIIFQLKYKNDVDEQLLYNCIETHINSSEFFHQKAIGWALRQYGKFNAVSVIDFVNSHDLKPLSKREALKHLG